MLTSALISKFIDVLGQANVEDNPSFIEVVNTSIEKTYTSLLPEEQAPVCQSKIAFTPAMDLGNVTLTPTKKKRGWPKGKPRKPKPASSTLAVSPLDEEAPATTETE
jgi:hypothetical protein